MPTAGLPITPTVSPLRTTQIGLKKTVARAMTRADRDADAGQKNHRGTSKKPPATPAGNHRGGGKEISAEFNMQSAGTLIEIVISILHFALGPYPCFTPKV